MKKVVFIVSVLFAGLSTQAQTYYNMWRGPGEAGKPEWIANSSLSYGFTGIQFTTADRLAGYANAKGRWFFLDGDQSVTSLQYISSVNNNLNSIEHLSAGSDGYMASSRWLLTSLDLSNNIDAFFGYGKNRDVTISNQVATWLRINSMNGIAFWGNGGAMNDDNPQFEVRGSEVNLYQTLKLKNSAKEECATWGFGLNDDIQLAITTDKWLRISTPKGFCVWTDGQAATSNTPQFQVMPTLVRSYLPVITDQSFELQKKDVTAAFKVRGNNDAAWFGTESNHGMEICTNSFPAMYIDNNNRIFLGFNKIEADGEIRSELKEKYNVFVKTGILSADYSIAPVNTWSDFVFSNEYDLKSLREVESFITENNHLPDVPSAEQVSKEGYSQHEMNRVLLQKIEELTLYTIQQQKEIEALKTELAGKK